MKILLNIQSVVVRDALIRQRSGLRWFCWFSVGLFLAYLAAGLALGAARGHGTGFGDGRVVHTIRGESPLHLENPEP